MPRRHQRVLATILIFSSMLAGALVGPRAAQAAPSLVVTKSANRSAVSGGDDVSYTIRYRCASIIENCTGVVLTDTVDTLVEIVSFSGPGIQIASATRSGDIVTWTMVDPLPAGSTGLVTVRVHVPACAAGEPAFLANAATINSTNAGSGSNSAATVAVNPIADCASPPTPPVDFDKVGYLANIGGIGRWDFAIPFAPSTTLIEDDLPTGVLVYNTLDNGHGIAVDCNGAWFDVSAYGNLLSWIEHADFPGASGCTRDTIARSGTSWHVLTNLDKLRFLVPAAATPTDTISFYVPLGTPADLDIPNCADRYAATTITAAAGSLIASDCGSVEVDEQYYGAELWKELIGSPSAPLNEPTSGCGYSNCEYPTLAEDPDAGIVMGSADLAFSLRASIDSLSTWMHDPVITDLLDPNLEYVAPAEGGTNWWVLRTDKYADWNHDGKNAIDPAWDPSLQPGCNDPTFEQLPDFAGTGRTLLRWTFDDCQLPGVLALSEHPFLDIYYSARIVDGTASGTTIRNNFHFDSLVEEGSKLTDGCHQAQIAAQPSTAGFPTGNDHDGSVDDGGWDEGTADHLDRDGDGDVAERLCRSAVVSYGMPTLAAADSSKWVRGALDTAFSRYPQSGDTTTSGDATYELQVANVGNTPLTSIDLVDVLPYVGDTSVTSPAANRLSDWSEALVAIDAIERDNGSGYVTVPAAEYTIGYSSATEPCRWDTDDADEPNRLKVANGVFAADPTVGPSGCVAGWSATGAVGARSFAWQYTPASVLAPGDVVRITIRVARSGALPSPLNGAVAWNSFGYAGRTGLGGADEYLLSTEPIKVGVTMVDTSTTASIGDFVWIDSDHDGTQDEIGTGVPGVRVGLYDGSTLVARTRSDGSGYYRFDGLDPNHSVYRVVLDDPADFAGAGPLAGHVLTTADIGSDSSDSDATMSAGRPQISLTPTGVAGSHTPTYDIGFWLPASLGDYVWEDIHADGGQQSGEPGVPGVTVRLHGASGSVVATTTTSASGYYLFDDLAAGRYSVSFDLSSAIGNGADNSPYSGYGFTSPDATGDDRTDSDAGRNGRAHADRARRR